MTKSKALLAALSVVAVAGMTTACSKHKANTLTPATDEAATSGSEQDAANQALLNKMATYQAISANLEFLVESRFSSEHCSDETVASMLNEGTIVERILKMDQAVRGIRFAADQLVRQQGDAHCKANALSDVAKKTLSKYVNNPSADVISSEEFDKGMNQASLIYSVIGPMFDMYKGQIELAEQTADKVEKKSDLETLIASRVGVINSQADAVLSGCQDPSCATVALDAKDKSEEIVSGLNAYMGINPNASLDTQIGVLETTAAQLAGIRDSLSALIGGTSAQEVGPNDRNGSAGYANGKTMDQAVSQSQREAHAEAQAQGAAETVGNHIDGNTPQPVDPRLERTRE